MRMRTGPMIWRNPTSSACPSPTKMCIRDRLESGETDTDAVQETLDEAVCGINDLQEEFDENDSEIETVARECIAATVAYILEWFGIPIDTEEAIRERDW